VACVRILRVAHLLEVLGGLGGDPLNPERSAREIVFDFFLAVPADACVLLSLSEQFDPLSAPTLRVPHP